MTVVKLAPAAPAASTGTTFTTAELAPLLEALERLDGANATEKVARALKLLELGVRLDGQKPVAEVVGKVIKGAVPLKGRCHGLPELTPLYALNPDYKGSREV